MNKTRLLIADDDHICRTILDRALSDDYELTLVTTCEELFALLRTCKHLYGAAVVDVCMPCGFDPQLRQLTAEDNIPLPTVYISANPVPPGILNKPSTAFLKKPFTHEQLLRTLKQLLSKRDAGADSGVYDLQAFLDASHAHVDATGLERPSDPNIEMLDRLDG